MLSSTRAGYECVVLSPAYVKEHIGRFIEIAADIPKESWVQDNYLYELPRKWEFSIAALDPQTGEVAGFIIASDKGTNIHIHKYAIHPALRSKGIGGQLLRFFEKKVKQKANSCQIGLYVDKDNPGAIGFYERNGFRFVEQVDSMVYYQKPLQVVVGIHQPNFIPWLGYFHKIAQSDKFIILDHVANKPSDGIYPKRVTIVCNHQPYWLSIPLVQPKDRLFVPINEMTISARENVGPKHLRTVEMSYKKTPFFKDFFYLFERFYNHASPLIAQRNIDLIKELCRLLQLPTPLHLSSDYGFTSASNELLIDLIKATGGNIYLHGSYAVSEKGYQDNALFIQNGIEPQLQQFQHPVYRQHNNHGDFIAGASIVDALMNVGAEQVVEMVNS